MSDQYLTPDELKKYLSGKLSGSERNLIERKLQADKFSADAVDGYESCPGSLQNLGKLKSQAEGKLFNPAKTSFLTGKIFILATTAIVLGISFSIFLLIFLNQDIKKNEPAAENRAIVTNLPTLNNPELGKAVSEVDSATVIPERRRISYKKTLPDVYNSDTGSARGQIETNTYLLSRKVVKVEPGNNTSQDGRDNLAMRPATRSTFPEAFVLDLKIADYTRIRLPYYKNTDTGNIDPMFENKDANSGGKKSLPAKEVIPYKTFMKQALKNFIVNDFKEALKELLVVLNQYPDDVNAHFYGGLCYYNIGKFDKAIVHFDFVISDPVNVFYEEGQWYKALACLENGDAKTAESTFREIISQKGFYADKAGKMVENK